MAKTSSFYVPPLSSKDQYIQNVAIQQLTQQVNKLAASVSTTTSATTIITIINPKDYGAFGDGNSHPITTADITAHSSWFGPFNQSPLTTYPVGTEWDTVGIQEAIYAAFASDSSPGSVSWNGAFGINNSKFFCPAGNYQINRQIWLAAQGFDFEFDNRLSTEWKWTGYATFMCNSHSSTTLDGISATDIAKLFVGQFLFDARTQTGVGSIPVGTKISTINVAGGSITISNAATSTVTGLVVQPQSSMFQCDPVAYGSFRKVGLTVSTQMLTANGASGPSMIAPWVLDASGVVGGMLDVQQLTFDNIYISGGRRSNYGLSILPVAGGGGQGDTVVFINPYIADTFVAGVVINGSNALSLQFVNGDFQDNLGYGIQGLSGSFYVYGTGFQNELNSLAFSPQLNQPTQITYDMFFGGGGGSASAGGAHDVRSEASCLLKSSNQGIATNCTQAAADKSDWFSAFGGFQLLSVIRPSSNNTKNRSFACVDNGGNNQWRQASPTNGGSSSGDTIVDLGSPNWTANQWVGFVVQFRFGSNGFTEHTASITSNTTNAITVTGSGIGNSVSTNSLYTIAAKTGGSAPNFDSASAGNYVSGGTGQGFTTTAGSSVITTDGSQTTGISTGNYLIITQGEIFGCSGHTTSSVPQITIPFTAQVTAKTTSTVTVNRIPSFSMTDQIGYWGAPVADNGVQWLELPYSSFDGLKSLINCIADDGYIRNCTHVDALETDRADHFYGGLQVGSLSPTPSTIDLNLKSGPTVKTPIAIQNAATVDLTDYFINSDVLTYTPNQTTTLNAPAPGITVSQEITIIILTSGVSSFTLTFNTNFKPNGTLATGATSGKYWIIKFVSDGTNWVEVVRSGPL